MLPYMRTPPSSGPGRSTTLNSTRSGLITPYMLAITQLLQCNSKKIIGTDHEDPYAWLSGSTFDRDMQGTKEDPRTILPRQRHGALRLCQVRARHHELFHAGGLRAADDGVEVIRVGLLAVIDSAEDRVGEVDADLMQTSAGQSDGAERQREPTSAYRSLGAEGAAILEVDPSAT